MTAKLKSRKLIAFVMVAASNLANGYFGAPIDMEAMQEVNELCVMYLLGQGAVDAMKELPALSMFGKQLGVKIASEQEQRSEPDKTAAE